MKNYILTAAAATILLLSIIEAKSQSLGINTDGNPAHPSAILDVEATHKGILIPRVDFNQLPANPPIGLTAYITQNGPFGNDLIYYYTGTEWTIFKVYWKIENGFMQTTETANPIINGSIGVGFDIVSGYNYNNNEIVVRENNTRIAFQDTDAGATDWVLKANESNNGGNGYLSILDVGEELPGGDPNSNKVFTVNSNSRSNAFFLQGENLGFGTNAPQQQLHIISSSAPSIRLYQNTSEAQNEAAWDITSNDVSLAIGDQLNSTSTFTVEAAAPNNSINIAGDGNVGFGTDTPDRQFHVNGTMRLEPLDTPPASPTKGDLYFDNTDNKLKCYDGTQWQELW